MRARTWESVLPLQSSSSLILASISREGDSPLVVALFFMLFAPHSALFLSCEGTNHQSGRHSLHDDSLRLAAIRISACDRESVCNLVDYGLELNASLLDKRCPRRAAAQTGSNAARIRAHDRNSFRFNPCRAEAGTGEQLAQETRIAHVVGHPELHLRV